MEEALAFSGRADLTRGGDGFVDLLFRAEEEAFFVAEVSLEAGVGLEVATASEKNDEGDQKECCEDECAGFGVHGVKRRIPSGEIFHHEARRIVQ